MENNITIRFLGAAGTVTGSKYLIQTHTKNILVDCGFISGIKETAFVELGESSC